MKDDKSGSGFAKDFSRNRRVGTRVVTVTQDTAALRGLSQKQAEAIQANIHPTFRIPLTRGGNV
jgi:hypothetical protein